MRALWWRIAAGPSVRCAQSGSDNADTGLARARVGSPSAALGAELMQLGPGRHGTPGAAIARCTDCRCSLATTAACGS
jgi:hypothetical protein